MRVPPWKKQTGEQHPETHSGVAPWEIKRSEQKPRTKISYVHADGRITPAPSTPNELEEVRKFIAEQKTDTNKHTEDAIRELLEKNENYVQEFENSVNNLLGAITKRPGLADKEITELEATRQKLITNGKILNTALKLESQRLPHLSENYKALRNRVKNAIYTLTDEGAKKIIQITALRKKTFLEKAETSWRNFWN